MRNENWTPEGVYEYMERVYGKILSKEQCKKVVFFMHRARYLAKKFEQGIDVGIKHAEAEVYSFEDNLETAIGEAKLALQEFWSQNQPKAAPKKSDFRLESRHSKTA